MGKIKMPTLEDAIAQALITLSSRYEKRRGTTILFFRLLSIYLSNT